MKKPAKPELEPISAPESAFSFDTDIGLFDENGERIPIRITAENFGLFDENGLDYPKARRIGSYMLVNSLELEIASIKAGLDPKPHALIDTAGNYVDNLYVDRLDPNRVGPNGTKKHTAYFTKFEDGGSSTEIIIAIDNIYNAQMMAPFVRNTEAALEQAA